MANRIPWSNKPRAGAVINTGHQLSQGLVGLWLLNEQGGKAGDISGKGNTGTLTNGAVWNNDSVTFSNGLTYYIQTPFAGNASGGPSGASKYSISLWVKPTGTLGTNQAMIGWYDSGNSAGFFMQTGATVASQILILAYNSGASYGESPVGSLVSGKLYHLVMVFDGTQSTNAIKMKLYINGIAQTISFAGTMPTSIGTITNNLRIGDAGALARYWTGTISNVRIYNRALSQQEAQELYSNPYVGIMMPRRRNITQQGGAAPVVLTPAKNQGNFFLFFPNLG